MSEFASTEETSSATPLLCSIRECCRLVGISRAQLYLLWAKGDGPPRVKIGTRTLLPRNDLKAWVEDLTRLSVIAKKKHIELGE